ncbi:uncharacterized protein LOC116342650 [Contarinia nasturtii]|uniref:uncharacterized protein LOC116342650 n=1 Tax=Contarinia nasturtii TaxID=265458 RepID=UPI0012D3AAF8|nr:uncharacterized protein LOC116342650 [Contarinia nasturtii]
MVIDLCRNVAKFLRLSSTKNAMKEAGLVSILPGLDVATRWSSTYLMIRSVLKCETVIKHFASRVNDMNQLLAKWDVLKEIKTVLHLPYLSTIMLQKENFTLSDFYGCLKVIDMKLSQMLSNPHQNCTDLAKNLKLHLDIRKKRLIENPLMQCALFLDPRFKCELDGDSERTIFMKLILDNVRNRIQSIKNDNEQTEEEETNSEVPNKSTDNMNDFYTELDQQYEASGIGALGGDFSTISPDYSKDKSDIAIAVNKYEHFVFGTRMKSSDSVHSFWESNKKTFGPELYEIASVIFAIPPTQTTVERYFSGLKLLFTEYRCQLSEDLLECCLLIHLNKDLYKKVKILDIKKVEESLKGQNIC